MKYLKTVKTLIIPVLCLFFFSGLSGCDSDKKKDGTIIVENVYFGGHMRTDTGTRPCYWYKNQYHQLDLPIGASSGYVKAISVSGNDIYAAGYVSSGNYKPCFWKNGIPFLLPGDSNYNSMALAIAVSNQVAYVAGFWTDASLVKHACYWKEGGTRYTLSSLYESKDSEARAIQIVGDLVYTAGYGNDSLNYNIPIIWKGEARTELILPDREKGGVVNALKVIPGISSDTIYAAGTMTGIDSNLKATYWTNGTASLSNAVTEGYDYGIVYDFIVENNIFYMAGISRDIYNMDFSACSWTGNTLEQLSDAGAYNDYYANGIAKIGNDIIISGYYIEYLEGFSSRDVPVFWFNGTMQILPVIDNSAYRGGQVNGLFHVQ